jgi:mevalonate kinase
MIKVSAPGKVIISGEYSVVWGEPAFLAAVDKRCWIEVEKTEGSKIRIIDEVLKKDQWLGKDEVLDFTTKIKKNWERLIETGEREYFEAIKHDPLGLVKIGVGETLMSLKKGRGGFELRIKNEIPIGVGLGSSAALSVCLVAGLGKVFEERPGLCRRRNTRPGLSALPLSLINKIAHEIEKRQHGRPSGGDTTICTYGGVLIFKKTGKKFSFRKLNLKKQLTDFLLVDTGKPAETTGEMLRMVELRIKNQESRIKNLLKKTGKITKKIIDVFENQHFDQLKELIVENERMLEELGVVGERAKRIMRLIEKNSGVAKICGAGGVKRGSGMALAYHKDFSVLKGNLKKNKIIFLKVKLGEKGVTIN